MKKNKKMKKYILLITAFSIFISCNNDFTDIEQENQLPAEGSFKTQEDAIQATNAIYSNLRVWQHVWANLAITAMTTDDSDKGSSPGDATFFNDFANFTFSPTSFVFGDYWKAHFDDINYCNQVISKVPAIKMDENLKSRLLAEAKFLRAMTYFNLVRTFGGVPIYDGLPADGKYNKPRNTTNEVYDFILSDLKSSSEVLPVSYSSTDTGRATKGAALAYLSKVYLYQKKWTEAQEASAQVMALGYDLFGDYNLLFRIPNENCIESIFEVQCKYTTANYEIGNSQWAQTQGVRDQWGWGFNNPTENLMNSYSVGDKRKDGTILYRGQKTGEGIVDKEHPDGDIVNPKAENPRYNKKAYVPTGSPNFGADGAEQNVRLMRFAEVLLINAEANNELGNSTAALTSLNKVRKRAGLAPSTTTNQANLRNEIYNERRWELAMEGDRFFDLVRTGRAAAVLNAVGKSFTAGKNEIFPIPESQIILSNGVLTQNPGY
jgi:hypothetical protein